jgi:hypothetical protein
MAAPNRYLPRTLPRRVPSAPAVASTSTVKRDLDHALVEDLLGVGGLGDLDAMPTDAALGGDVVLGADAAHVVGDEGEVGELVVGRAEHAHAHRGGRERRDLLAELAPHAGFDEDLGAGAVDAAVGDHHGPAIAEQRGVRGADVGEQPRVAGRGLERDAQRGRAVLDEQQAGVGLAEADRQHREAGRVGGPSVDRLAAERERGPGDRFAAGQASDVDERGLGGDVGVHGERPVVARRDEGHRGARGGHPRGVRDLLGVERGLVEVDGDDVALAGGELAEQVDRGLDELVLDGGGLEPDLDGGGLGREVVLLDADVGLAQRVGVVLDQPGAQLAAGDVAGGHGEPARGGGVEDEHALGHRHAGRERGGLHGQVAGGQRVAVGVLERGEVDRVVGRGAEHAGDVDPAGAAPVVVDPHVEVVDRRLDDDRALGDLLVERQAVAVLDRDLAAVGLEHVALPVAHAAVVAVAAADLVEGERAGDRERAGQVVLVLVARGLDGQADVGVLGERGLAADLEDLPGLEAVALDPPAGRGGQLDRDGVAGLAADGGKEADHVGDLLRLDRLVEHDRDLPAGAELAARVREHLDDRGLAGDREVAQHLASHLDARLGGEPGRPRGERDAVGGLHVGEGDRVLLLGVEGLVGAELDRVAGRPHGLAGDRRLNF